MVASSSSAITGGKAAGDETAGADQRADDAVDRHAPGVGSLAAAVVVVDRRGEPGVDPVAEPVLDRGGEVAGDCVVSVKARLELGVAAEVVAMGADRECHARRGWPVHRHQGGTVDFAFEVLEVDPVRRDAGLGAGLVARRRAEADRDHGHRSSFRR